MKRAPLSGHSPRLRSSGSTVRTLRRSERRRSAVTGLERVHLLTTTLRRRYVSIHVPFYDLHSLHRWTGTFIGWAGLVHATFHVVRWASQDRARFLWETTPGRSGVVAMVSMLIIVLPMAWRRLKTRLRYEVRTRAHAAFVAGQHKGANVSHKFSKGSPYLSSLRFPTLVSRAHMVWIPSVIVSPQGLVGRMPFLRPSIANNSS